MVQVRNLEAEEQVLTLQSVPVVKEYSNVFPKENPGSERSTSV